MIGVVAEIEPKRGGMFQSIEVHPTVDFSRLESVLVLTNEARDAERAAATPSTPRGAPSEQRR